MPDVLYEVDDPVIGFVTCASLEEAKAYAAKVCGDIYRSEWENGEEVSLTAIAL